MMSPKNRSTHWNLALPSMVDSKEPVLPVVINDITFGIPLSQVQYVDHAGPLTLLPLTSPPIEGLIRFNGLPLIQLNVAQALGFESHSNGKVVIMTLPQGYIALKVDEVLGFISAREEGTDQIGTTQQDLPLLEVNEVFPWIKNIPIITASIAVSDTSIDKTHDSISLNNYMLLVSSGNHTIGLLADSVDRIEGIDDVLLLRKEDSEVDLLVRIEDVLLPARSLASLLKLENKPEERQAILISGLEKPSVLTVERVSQLEKINHFHLTTSPSGTNSLWHLTEDNQLIEVVNAREFFGKTEEYTTLPLVNPQSRWDNLPQLATQSSTEGVRIQCGDIICVLPLTLVERILGDLEEEGLEPTNSTEKSFDELRGESGKVPVIDCVTLLGQHHHNKVAESHLLLSLKCGYVVIAVHRIELQPTLADDQWFPLILLPPIATLLFDAAAFSESEQKWILRVRTDLDLAKSPWEVKRLLVSSLLAWIHITKLEKTTEGVKVRKRTVPKRSFLSDYENLVTHR